MSTSAALIAFRRKSFNCRSMIKMLIHIKYVKNANHLGIIWNNKRTLKNIPANIKTYLSWKSGLQLVLNVTVSLFPTWKASCRRICFNDFFKRRIRNFLSQFFSENITIASTVSLTWNWLVRISYLTIKQ